MKFANTPRSLGLKILVLITYSLIFFFLIPSVWGIIWFVVGVLCGAGLLVADERSLYRWYREKDDAKFLVSRSPLFLLSLIPLTIFVLTSSGSYWASGVVGGLILWLLLEMTERRADPTAFDQRFLSNIKGEVSPQHIQLILLSGWSFFALIHLLVIL